MRKVVYSSITKMVAVVLFIACIISGVLIAADGVLEYYNQEEEIYLFESDFSESWYISNLLGDPQGIVYNAYHSVGVGNRIGVLRVKKQVFKIVVNILIVRNIGKIKRREHILCNHFFNHIFRGNDHIISGRATF